MKKIVLTLLAASSLSVCVAQKVRFGAKAGLNLSLHSVDFGEDRISNPNTEWLTGYCVGVFAEIKLDKNLALQPELLFTKGGTRFEADSKGLGYFSTITGKQKNNYISLPVLIKYYATPKLFFLAGPQLGYLLHASQSSSVAEVIVVPTITGFTPVTRYSDSPGEDNKADFKPLDFGLVFGGGYFITKNIFAEARFNLGLSNIYKQIDKYQGSALIFDDQLVIKSRSIQITVGYQF